ncbi:hypothetical protein OPQ81_008682 [Rhizoctonia solani]|nr:hypothetical protein OPQ81_008682 [Rhizoctonia solani]
MHSENGRTEVLRASERSSLALWLWKTRPNRHIGYIGFVPTASTVQISRCLVLSVIDTLVLVYGYRRSVALYCLLVCRCPGRYSIGVVHLISSRRIRHLISQSLRTQYPALARTNIPPIQCPASTKAPRTSPSTSSPKSQRKPQQEQGPRPPLSPEDQAIRQRITPLLSTPTNAETERELVELRNTRLSSPKLVCLLAEALVYHAYVPDALDLVNQSRKNGMEIPPRLYESVVFRLAERNRWAEILALLEPLQSLSPSTSKQTAHVITTRLCEWRVRACAQLGDFAGMERALGMFPHGITRRTWKIAEQACLKNSDPRMAARIREVLVLDKRFREKDKKASEKPGEAEDRKDLQPEEIAQVLVRHFKPRDTTFHDAPTTTQITRAPQENNRDHPTYLITIHHIPSTSSNALDPCYSFTPDTRLATRCVRTLVQNNRVTEAAIMVAAMCKGTPSAGTAPPRPTSQTSTHEPPLLSLSEIFASVRPDIHLFNALLKGVLNTRGLSGMLALLEIMHDANVKPDSETAALLLRYLDRQRAWSPGRLIDTLVDLTAPIPKDYNNDPAVPPKPQPVPVSIRHTNVILGSILNSERNAILGGGWKASAAFLKYRNRPMDRWPPSDARLASSPDNIDPPTAGLKFKARADSLKPVLEALRARGVRNDSMAYALRAQRDGVVRLDPEAGRQVLHRADILLGDYHYAALMAGLVECGYMDSAKAVMKSAHENGFGVGSPVMYTILITGYGRMGLPRPAERVFKQMILAKVKPDAIAVDALAGAWFISGEYERARQAVLRYWPGDGELPFSDDTPLKKMVTELRKLRPDYKIRQKASQVSGEEDSYVGPIVQAIKAPDKSLPLAPIIAGEKKDNGGPKPRRYSSVAGVGLQLDGVDWVKPEKLAREMGSTQSQGHEISNLTAPTFKPTTTWIALLPTVCGDKRPTSCGRNFSTGAIDQLLVGPQPSERFEMTAHEDLHAIPITERPPQRLSFRGLAFLIVFNIGCLCTNGSQLLLVPLALVAPQLYRALIRKTKASFGLLLVLMCQWFAPTSLVVTCEGGKGIEEVVVVMMPNHQIYADWWYLWCLSYSMRAHADVLIILKDSLKWIPIVGWGMQFFRFIFLARSWAHDKQRLTSHLTQLARTAAGGQLPFLLLLFPEGTLVSPQTRPLSAKYAAKTGIQDMQHILLPRSTGLLFCLRALAPHMPSLKLLDVTVAYPGIPRGGYGQAYYTLRSIFMQGVPPPRVHVHLRLYDVARDVPIGLPRGAEEANETERAAFDQWLLARWKEKDDLMEQQLTEGRFRGPSEKPVASSVAISGGKETNEWDEERACDKVGSGAVEWPVRLNSKAEILDAFCWFMPFVTGVVFWKLSEFIKFVA